MILIILLLVLWSSSAMAEIDLGPILGAITDGMMAQASILLLLVTVFGGIMGLRMVETMMKRESQGYSQPDQIPAFVQACDDADIEADQFEGNDWEGLESWISEGEHPVLGKLEEDDPDNPWGWSSVESQVVRDRE